MCPVYHFQAQFMIIGYYIEVSWFITIMYGHIFIIGHGIGLQMHFQMDIYGMSSHYAYFLRLWITWYTRIMIPSSGKVSYGRIEYLQSISTN